jgi:adenosylcobinamide kinase/adenosylcobinamide-phosphate guanylyltransferase
MGKSILVTGGARSGKSALAERLVLSLGDSAVYIATAEAGDAEMAARIAAHRTRRGACWRTVEERRDLVGVLDRTDGGPPRLVDCLTLWLSNLMLAGQDWRADAEALAGGLRRQSSPVVIVTNEVGAGIVPESALARSFRDAAGEVNQMIASVVDEVWLTVAGLPLRLKPND